MSERVSAKLYKIQDAILEEYSSPEKLIDEIINSYFERTKNKFRKVELKQELNNEDFKSKLFVFDTKLKNPTWYDFVESIVADSSELLRLKTKHSTFTLFIYSDSCVYAVSKGYYGKYLLEEYMDNFFGLDVLSRLVDKTDTDIRQLEERAIFGIEIGAQRFFRSNFNLIYDDDFGKIYKKMLASISEDDFSRLGIHKKREDTFNVTAQGSSSFEVSTNFDYEELINRIKCIETLLESEGVQFNQFYRVPKSELSKIKDKLNEELLNTAYKAYINDESIDFYHPNVIDYLASVELRFVIHGVLYEIPYGSSSSYIEIIQNLIDNSEFDNSDKINFIESLKESTGAFRLQENEYYSNYRELYKWIGGEVELNKTKYFKIDNEWYKYSDDFDGYLNRYFENIDFNKITPKVHLDDWKKEISREDKYNSGYKERNNFILTDKVFVNNLEICDLIKITDEELFLYHIKKGLGRDLRVLYNQIINSARLITNSIKEKEYRQLKKYYQSIRTNHYKEVDIIISINNQNVICNEEIFLDQFLNKKITYVFAYSSPSNSDMKDEIISTNSRIAKLSLLYCIRDMKRIDTELLIEKINVV